MTTKRKTNSLFSYTDITKLSIMLVLTMISAIASSQQFWRLTNEFPGGPKTGITLVNDTVLFVGLTHGIIKSNNNGQNFETTLHSNAIFTLFSTVDGTVIAGGAGKIYTSSDFGKHWDSIKLNTTYPILQIIENSRGNIFAITGALDFELGYVGDGVFCSVDNALSWEKRNCGLGNYTSCEKIEIDKNDRLYLSVADEYASGFGGLYISENHGLNWQHINISIEGKGVVSNQIDVNNCTGLSVSPDDSVFYSIKGIAVNALVQLNIKKHINDIMDNEFWNIYEVFNAVSWWLDWPLNNVHFANNNIMYSSTRGSLITGKTWYLAEDNNKWIGLDYGLGLNMYGFRDVQYFAENLEGTLFMVQLLDERVYYKNRDENPALVQIETSLPEIQVYPNPVRRGEDVFIKSNNLSELNTFSIFDSLGKKIRINDCQNRLNTFIAPAEPGIYLLIQETMKSRTICRFIVE